MRPLLWLPMFALRAGVGLLGFLMVPLMLSTDNRPRWLFRPWSNPTDGNHGAQWWPRYVETRGNWLAKRFPSFYWCAIRNPANGLRTYPWITVDSDLAKLEWRHNDRPTNPAPLRAVGKRLGWFYVWQGPYSGFWLCYLWNAERHAKIRIGWKLLPDEPGITAEWKPKQVGFALSVLPYRKG